MYTSKKVEKTRPFPVSIPPSHLSQGAGEWRVNQAAAHHLHPHNPTPGAFEIWETKETAMVQITGSFLGFPTCSQVLLSNTISVLSTTGTTTLLSKHSLVSLGQGQFLLAAAKVLSLPQNVLPPHDLTSLFLVNNFCLKPKWMKKIYVKSCFTVSQDINTVFCWLQLENSVYGF